MWLIAASATSEAPREFNFAGTTGMDSEQLLTALNAVIHRLVLLATEDAQLRSELRRLAEAVLEITSDSDQQVAPRPSVEEIPAGVSPTAGEASEPAVTIEPVADQEPSETRAPDLPVLPASPPAVLPELTLGQAKPADEPAPVSYPARWLTTTTADFSVIEARCRLKAEGARWAATRRRLLAEGVAFATEIEPMDRAIISRAKAITDCFLWMCHPSGPSPSNPKLYEEVACCFETVADILAIVKQLQDDPDARRAEFESSLDLLAEAQSALRIAIATIDGPTDTDQMQVFNWLKATAGEKQIFIQRYMRADDPADPDRIADLDARIEELDARIEAARGRDKKRKKLMGKVRHKTSVIAGNPEQAEEQWQSLMPVLEELLDDGLPPSNAELRELLVPVIDSLPEDAELPAKFQLVLREIDRFMAEYPPPETKLMAPPPQQVQDAAKLLQGKSLVLIGGDRRSGAYQAIKDAFGLKDLIWIETREHQSIEGFEPYVARPDVAAVLLAIRWASHSYGDVREFCDRHGKPLVRLPGGYNTNQVAAQIMAQCSERLTGS
jgi:hypothetical protein